eukprot:Sdes_comp16408_c0_seq1m5755
MGECENFHMFGLDLESFWIIRQPKSTCHFVSRNFASLHNSRLGYSLGGQQHVRSTMWSIGLIDGLDLLPPSLKQTSDTNPYRELWVGAIHDCDQVEIQPVESQKYYLRNTNASFSVFATRTLSNHIHQRLVFISHPLHSSNKPFPPR